MFALSGFIHKLSYFEQYPEGSKRRGRRHSLRAFIEVELKQVASLRITGYLAHGFEDPRVSGLFDILYAANACFIVGTKKDENTQEWGKQHSSITKSDNYGRRAFFEVKLKQVAQLHVTAYLAGGFEDTRVSGRFDILYAGNVCFIVGTKKDEVGATPSPSDIEAMQALYTKVELQAAADQRNYTRLGGPTAELTLAGGVCPAGAGFLAGGDSGLFTLAALLFWGISPIVVVLVFDVVPGVFFKDSKALS
ncbi:hypothetical protein MRX96_041382 [Rhipicephalus microplus]